MLAEFRPLSWIHQTDLFRPLADPDDHWDLACVYAIAALGRADLRGIVIDYPPPNRPGCNPDLQAVAQLNYHHGLAAPVVVGSSIPVASTTHTQADAPAHERAAVNFILRTLRESPAPVILHLVGSCRDYALALNTDPDLFAKKCAGIYLNAGLAKPRPNYIDYNVRMNPAAYAALFNARCPIFWMPPFGDTAEMQNLFVEEFGTWFDFCQGDVFPHLPRRLQNYFASALGNILGADWLKFLETGDGAEILKTQNDIRRNMWSTAGFFHAAGLTVTRTGQIVPLNDPAAADRAFEFLPVAITCSPDGTARWTPAAPTSNRHLFHVRDLAAYPAAMTTALRALLSGQCTEFML